MRQAVARIPLKRLTLDDAKVTAMAQQLWKIAGPTCCNVMKLPHGQWGELGEKTKAQWKAIASAALMKGATL